MTEHLLHGKPLHECSCEELSIEGNSGESLAAMATLTDKQNERLSAIWKAFDDKPEDEKAAFQAKCEQEE